MKTTIYVKVLKKATNTVFCVGDKGQKTYFDRVYGLTLPYASGQNIKHSFIDKFVDELEIQRSPTTFTSNISNEGKISEGEVYGTCNPLDPDQLIGGWMQSIETEESKIKNGKIVKNKKTNEEDSNDELEKSDKKVKKDTKTIKRRSPFSISAMSPLHPYLVSINHEICTFDRSGVGNNIIVLTDGEGNNLSVDQIDDVIEGYNKNLTRKYIGKGHDFVNGLFYTEIAIDLRKLFCVTINGTELEITKEVKEKLIESGWSICETIEGKALLAPKEYREKLIPAIAEALIEYRGTTNQSRNFSSMETLALSISDNANKSAASIRSRINPDKESSAIPIIEEHREGVDMYITPSAEAFIQTESSDWDALDNAKKKLIELMKAFDYEHQIKN